MRLTAAAALLATGCCREAPHDVHENAQNGALRITYPLDGAVLPRGLAPPLVQTEGGAGAVIVRVEGAGDAIEVEARGGEAALDEGRFRQISEPPGREARLRIEARDGRGQRASVEIVVGTEPLIGVLYAWSSSHGQLQRWSPSRPVFEPVFEMPGRGGPGKAPCGKCHSVSGDGRTMLVSLHESPGAAAVVDLPSGRVLTDAENPPYRAQFQAMHPTLPLAVVTAAGALKLVDLARREAPSLIDAAGLPDEGASHPSWAPSGRALVHIAGTESKLPTDFTRGDVVLRTFDAETRSFSPPRTVAAGAGEACAYPSVLPGGEAVVFQLGESSRGSTDGGAVRRRSTLSLAVLDEPQPAPRRLDRASRDPSGAPFLSGYQPSAPVAPSGRYHFVAFVSLRPYGNHLHRRYRRQIWLTAVDRDLASADPSHPPVWLPGQSLASSMMMPGWAREPSP